VSHDTTARALGGARAAGSIVLACAGMAGIALLVQRYDPPVVLAGMLLALGAGALIHWPHAATAITAFLLYVNFPAILTKQVGLPAPVAGAFILLLSFPLLYLLLIQRERLRGDATFTWMIAFLGVLVVSSLDVVDSATAFGRVMQFALEGLLLYWLFVNVIRTRAVLQRVILTVVAAGALVSGLSLYQQVTGSYQQEFGGLAYRNYTEEVADEEADVQVRPRSSYRAQGPTDEPNRFAQILIVLLPLAVLSHRGATSAASRNFAVVAGLLIMTGIGLTLSRGAFLNVLLMAGAMAALRWIRPLHLAGALLAVALLVPVVSPRAVPRMLSIVNARFLAADDPATRAGADGAIRGRTTSMLTALNVFRDHPLIGVGPGQFRFHYAQYADNPDVKFRVREGPRRAHNLYLEIAAETGVAGLLVFLAILFSPMQRLWRMRRAADDPLARDLATAFVLSLLAYLGTGVFLHLAYQRYLWFLIALAGAAVHVLASEMPAAQPERAARPRTSRFSARILRGQAST